MVALAVTVDDKQVRAMLTRLATRVTDLRPVLSKAGDILRTDALDNFKGQHASDGTPWRGLSRATLLSRARRLSGGKGIHKKNGQLRAGAVRVMTGAKALLDTGVLRASIGQPSSGGIMQVTSNSVTIGSRIKYAAIHQFGGKAGRGKKVIIPARPFIGMSKSAERNIIDTINGYLGTNQ